MPFVDLTERKSEIAADWRVYFNEINLLADGQNSIYLTELNKEDVPIALKYFSFMPVFPTNVHLISRCFPAYHQHRSCDAK
jgi:hypothetical protein